LIKPLDGCGAGFSAPDVEGGAATVFPLRPLVWCGIRLMFMLINRQSKPFGTQPLVSLARHNRTIHNDRIVNSVVVPDRTLVVWGGTQLLAGKV
jgi:hypothetical protein